MLSAKKVLFGKLPFVNGGLSLFFRPKLNGAPVVEVVRRNLKNVVGVPKRASSKDVEKVV